MFLKSFEIKAESIIRQLNKKECCNTVLYSNGKTVQTESPECELGLLYYLLSKFCRAINVKAKRFAHFFAFETERDFLQVLKLFYLH